MDAAEELFFSSEIDYETKDLELLFHSFSSFSIEEIASAYCRAEKDVEIAAGILSGLRKEGLDQVGQSDGAYSLEPTDLGALDTDPEHRRVKSVVCSNYEGRPFNYPHNNEVVDCMQKNMKKSKNSKSRKASVSIGTVSSIIGKAYARPGFFQREPCEQGRKTSPTVKEIRKSDMTMDVVASVCEQSKKSDHMKSIEEFLFSMFGDGFHLNKDLIRDVLGNCDYDVQQAAKELLMRTSTFEDSTFEDDHVHNFRDGDMLACTEREVVACNEDIPNEIHAHSEDGLKSRDSEPCVAIKKNNLEREVIESLFRMPERSEQLPKKTVKTKVAWKPKIVAESHVEASPVEPNLHPDEDKDNLYQAKVSEFQTLRKSAQQQWDAMKAYYEAAAEAYSEGNLDRAKYLLEEEASWHLDLFRFDLLSALGDFLLMGCGRTIKGFQNVGHSMQVDQIESLAFHLWAPTLQQCTDLYSGKVYNRKACELDEQSAIFFDSNEERQSDVTLDVHDHGKRQAIQLLKLHLLSLSGIPSIQFLKIIAEIYPQTGSGGRNLQSIAKFLDKEHIKWHGEEGNPGTIIVRLVDVERDRLSFADKKH